MLHDGMDFPLRLAQGFQMSNDLIADVLALNCASRQVSASIIRLS